MASLYFPLKVKAIELGEFMSSLTCMVKNNLAYVVIYYICMIMNYLIDAVFLVMGSINYLSVISLGLGAYISYWHELTLLSQIYYRVK